MTKSDRLMPVITLTVYWGKEAWDGAKSLYEEFGRTSNLSIDFTHAPYYAVETRPGLQVSLGGILVDDDLRVVKDDGGSFENLYAVGECADDGLFGGGPTNVNITFGKGVAEHILGKN